MFNLEQSIKAWRKKLQKYQGLEPGDLEELEAHLRDKIDHLLTKGYDPEEAFQKASSDMTDGIREVISEFRTSRTNGKNPPAWKSRSWMPTLLPNYLKVTFRNFWRQKVYGVINVAGLAIGIASCLLILMYINHELSYDGFHKNSNRIYRVNTDYKWGDQQGVGSTTPPALGRTFREEIPEVESYVRIYKPQPQVVRQDDRYFSESSILATDSKLFDIFSFKLLKGNPQNVLEKPNSIVLTPEMARKYFDNESPIGQTLELGKTKSAYTVTGIVAPPPSNSHIQFNMLTSLSTYGNVEYFEWSWVWTQLTTYVMLNKNASLMAAEAKIPSIVNQHLPATFKRIGFSFQELVENGGHWKYNLQPFNRVWLHSAQAGNILGGTGNILYIYILGTAAIFILLIACINFMNLATARSITRGKEVGIRKTLGSSRQSLAGQFLIEALIYSFTAAVLACLIINLSLPGFNELAGTRLSFNLIDQPWIIPSLLALAICVGLLSGSYPAVALTSYQPVEVLKGTLQSGSKGRRLRSTLVVGQFVISIMLIIGTLIVHNQLQFMQNKDLGFNKEQVLVIDNGKNLGTSQETLRKELVKIPGILSASLTSSYPTKSDFTDFYRPENSSGKDLPISSILTDRHFINTLDIKLLAGRNFRQEAKADSASVIINREAAKNIGWKPGEAIGKKLIYPGGNNQKFTVIGVMNDFNYYSLQNPIGPFAFFNRSSKSYTTSNDYIVARFEPTQIQGTLQKLSTLWKDFMPETPFEYEFLSDRFAAQYRSQLRMGMVFSVFTIIAILIACMGLLGLVTFTTEQRTKEIGIRKVLGASTGNIMILLSKKFVRLTVIAFLIACPIAYFGMQQWLQDFAYRISIGPSIFILSGAMALLLVLITVSFQAAKAAFSNPVNSLRSE